MKVNESDGGFSSLYLMSIHYLLISSRGVDSMYYINDTKTTNNIYGTGRGIVLTKRGIYIVLVIIFFN